MKTFSFIFLFIIFSLNFIFAYNCNSYSDDSLRAIGDVDGNKIIDKIDSGIIFELFLAGEYLVCADINKNGQLDDQDLNSLNLKLDSVPTKNYILTVQNASSPFGEISVTTSNSSGSLTNVNILISSPKSKEVYSMNNILLTVRDTNNKAKIWKYSLNGGEKVLFDNSKNIFLTAIDGENRLEIYAFVLENSSFVSKNVSFSVKSSAVNSDSDISSTGLSSELGSSVTDEEIANNLASNPLLAAPSLFSTSNLILISLVALFVIFIFIFLFFYFKRGSKNQEEASLV